MSENLKQLYTLSQSKAKNLTRISALQSSIKGKYDFYAVFNGVNLTYFSGFSGATAMLIPQQGESTLYVSSVNYEQAKVETTGLTVQLLKRGENPMEKIANQAAPNKLAIDSMPIEAWRALVKAMGDETRLEPASNIVRDLRKIKDEQEIQLIREACSLAEIGMQVAFETVKPGIQEKQVAAQVEYAMRKKGSDGTSFDTIIASGPNSAFPHGSCSNRTIREGDLIVVDLGATYRLYRSDMTRTFTTGKPSKKQRKIYEAVKSAQQRAFETIKPNIQATQVDTAARLVIEQAGFGGFFVHNLGHGVGLEVHEAPILSPDSKEILAVGNVVTDEPGIYLPGYGGVRIEDTILVNESGAEKLTNGLYSLETNR